MDLILFTSLNSNISEFGALSQSRGYPPTTTHSDAPPPHHVYWLQLWSKGLVHPRASLGEKRGRGGISPVMTMRTTGTVVREVPQKCKRIDRHHL